MMWMLRLKRSPSRGCWNEVSEYVPCTTRIVTSSSSASFRAALKALALVTHSSNPACAAVGWARIAAAASNKDAVAWLQKLRADIVVLRYLPTYQQEMPCGNEANARIRRRSGW